MNTGFKKNRLIVKKTLEDWFETIIEEIKQVIIDEYDDKLTGFKVNNKSLIDYNMYRDEFISRLNEFQFINYRENGITLDVPDMETFDFSDGLEIVEIMMEGLSGVYVELNEKEYLHVFGRKPMSMKALDKNASPKNRVFLERYIGKVSRAEKVLNTRFIRFPFSNTPSLDILEVGALFVESNLESWLYNVTDISSRGIANTYK